jgi:ankyrin repeat protein
MKNLFIFCYFVFLFKLAFAQTLPSLPGLGGQTLDQGSEVISDFEEPELALDDFNIPDMPFEDEGEELPAANVTNENKLESNITAQESQPDDLGLPDDFAAPSFGMDDEQMDMPEPPTFEDFGNDNIGDNKPLDNSDIATPSLEEPADLQIDQFRQNEIAGDSAIESNNLNDDLISREQIENAAEELKFPETPELGFTPRKSQRESEEKILNEQEREKKIQELLGQVFEETGDSEIEAIENKSQKTNTANIGKPDNNSVKSETEKSENGRVKHKPLTYSEQQLVQQLIKSAMSGDKGSVIALLHSGRDANSKNAAGETPLMAAVFNGHNEIVEILLAEGANPNVNDRKGNTPLHVAASRNNFFAVQQLIRNGAFIDPRNNESDTPLLLATLNNSFDTVDTLVREGADVNLPNRDGITPLHVAAHNGNIEIVKYLLYVGSNANMITAKGFKPYDLAYGRNFNIARLLLKYTGQERYVYESFNDMIKENSQPLSTPDQGYRPDQYSIFPEAYQEQPEEQKMQNKPQWWGQDDKSNSSFLKMQKPESMRAAHSANRNANLRKLPDSLNNQNLRRVSNANAASRSYQNRQISPTNLKQFQTTQYYNNRYPQRSYNSQLTNKNYTHAGYSNNTNYSAPVMLQQIPTQQTVHAQMSGSQYHSSTQVNSATPNVLQESLSYFADLNDQRTRRIPRSLSNIENVRNSNLNDLLISEPVQRREVPLTTTIGQNAFKSSNHNNDIYQISANSFNQRNNSYKSQGVNTGINNLNESRYQNYAENSQNVTRPVQEISETLPAPQLSVPQSMSREPSSNNISRNFSANLPQVTQVQQQNMQTLNYQNDDIITFEKSPFSDQPTRISSINKAVKSEVNYSTQNRSLPKATSRNKSENILTYNQMTMLEKQKWDSRMEKWVKAGIKIKQMTPKQVSLWKKQRKLLQQVYKERFRTSVERTKRKVITELKRENKYGKLEQESEKVFTIVGLRREA